MWIVRASRGRGEVPRSEREVAGPDAMFVGARELDIVEGCCGAGGGCCVVVWRLRGAEPTSAMMVEGKSQDQLMRTWMTTEDRTR